MIFIKIKEYEMDQSNEWVKDNVNEFGGEFTFTVNCIDEDGDTACVISLPEDNSDYLTAMKEQFGWTYDFPELYYLEEDNELYTSVMSTKPGTLPGRGGLILNTNRVTTGIDTSTLTQIEYTYQERDTSIIVGGGGGGVIGPGGGRLHPT
jgi:hypothetical protein